jgi:surface antigen
MPPIRLLLRLLVFVVLAAGLSACGSPSGGGSAYGVAMGGSSRAPGVSCAPFARELSGIALYGDAADWWSQASGQYARGPQPVLGSVLVFRRSGRLPSGHVSVVSRILGARQVQVTQANWVPGELARDQLVVDVSEENDWSSVRVWYPPVRKLGTHPYATYGFILPRRPATHAELLRATAPAARYALETRGRPPPRARLAGG